MEEMVRKEMMLREVETCYLLLLVQNLCLGYHPDMESSGRNPNDEHHTITSSALGGGAHFMMKPPQGMHMTHARPSEWGGTGYDLSAEVEDPARCEIGGPPAVDGSVVASPSVEDGGLAQPNVLGGRVSRQSRKRRRVVEKYEEEPELEVAQDIEDDCAVYGDEDCNGVDDAIRGGDNDVVEEDANDANDADGEDANDADGEDANDAFEEDANLNIEEDFHEAFRVDEDGSDHDSGDDIWDEDRIPDPLSSDDEDEVRGEEETTRRDENEPEGYSKMLKRSSIAALFKERVRLNPKMTKHEMVAEIKREYKLEVTPNQCAKAKTKGLIKAIHTILPQAEHRQCCKHIIDNWKRDNHDLELQRLFWKIARSYTIEEFNNHMAELKAYNPHAYDSLQLTSLLTWSRAFFRIRACCNDNLNNLSESFNRTIRQARRKPLVDMLEDIRRQCMVRTTKRYLIVDKLKTRFTKRAHDEKEKMVDGASWCERHLARNNLHEIFVNNVGYFVDMDLKTCGCRKWEMVGIPCIHAASVIIGRRQKVEDYVSDYYIKRKWLETYKDGIMA
ncbi:Zinc finger PMZ-type [Arabidopsis thaliana x Arabidopsis arenosa]|uniref:Zinc finger PMZ-type n=1 Tax=Arabidopsis thaliana x Arabidopsis arenosa TaxID=1240361 RepID=A0A8T2CWF9_9BRAS|nr:Zinc finger PMZ-type [Arabidopsis thaliana x Arabidopsis arenosa]